MPALAQSRARVPLVASAPVQDLRFRAKVLLGGAKVVRVASGHATTAQPTNVMKLWSLQQLEKHPLPLARMAG